MRGKHQNTLVAIYSQPTPSGIVFADIENLVKAIDGSVREGEGSRVSFEFNGGARLYMHRPHPGKEAKRYQVRDVRLWLASKGVKP